MVPALRRLYALLLAAAFMAGVGQTDADALLYHSGGPHPADVPHFDQPGGCGSHAEHCVLAFTASLRQLASGLVRLPDLTLAKPLSTSARPTDTLRPADRINLQPTRAPPTAS